jgi:glucose-6-phosphate 1-dehydrogenase
MNDCAIILLGATGDLSTRKIFPALYTLFKNNKLGNSIIIGAALSEVTAQQLLENAKKYIKPSDGDTWHAFSKRVLYFPVNFSNPEDFNALAAYVAVQEKKGKLAGNRIVYCATAPYFYCTITQGLAASGLIKKMQNVRKVRQAHHEREEDSGSSSARPELVQGFGRIYNRIVYEKPFGHDLASAQEINACIAAHFEEHQIFRIDHYLTKELVGNIALVRFTNIVFEPLWNNRYIDHVQIIFDEEVCLDGRGAFYDKYGALADVMQNHMMQLVALIGMEAPQKLTGDFIRTERAKVLQKVKVIDALLGQYKGYHQEQGVAPDSKTETFAEVYVRIDNPRWAGVPFYLKAGKCLDKKETTIYIKFKQVDCLLSKACPSESNNLTIEISPNPLFALTLNAKVPGKNDEVSPVKMTFASDVFGPQSPEAYETLIEEILKGEQSVSVRFDEIEYAWKIIDAVRALKPPLYEYERRSKGPQEGQELFQKKHGMRWIDSSKSKGIKK